MGARCSRWADWVARGATGRDEARGEPVEGLASLGGALASLASTLAGQAKTSAGLTEARADPAETLASLPEALTSLALDSSRAGQGLVGRAEPQARVANPWPTRAWTPATVARPPATAPFAPTDQRKSDGHRTRDATTHTDDRWEDRRAKGHRTSPAP
jgi:hypothetical protein